MAITNDNTIPGAVLLGLAGAVAWMSVDMGSGAAGATLAPNFFPLVCAAGIALCGVALLARGLTVGGKPLPALVDRRFAVVAVLLGIYFWWFAQIDFRVGAFVVALGTLLAFGIRRPLLLALYPAGLTAVLYLAFTEGFGVVLPSWN
ncbi:tripartite tricarboxylate transporter TctB family protein [Amorphus sp. MBR-141]